MRDDQDWFPMAIVVLLLAVGSCGARPSEMGLEPPGFNVLFIGNSLTAWNDMPGMVKGMLEAGGVPVGKVEVVAHANFGLQDHWESGPARQRIASGVWNVVVMQQGPSATEGRPSLLHYARLFAAEIRKAGAQPAMYMVWPAAARSLDFDGVSDSYRTAAEEIEGLLLPAGDAWRQAWGEDADLELYGQDRFHPSRLGSYLAALVIYQGLSGNDPRLLEEPAGMVQWDAGVVKLLKNAAFRSAWGQAE